ncbi:MAG: hypothetical protein CBD34_01645 [Rickettsiales bacterium TMED174]|nr:MAG: hypothetical protein CBD34_01645 [Rickettsiales bacterium TMED174]
MYYIRIEMKNNIFIILNYLFFSSLIILLILYLFPGSLIGYLFYGDLGRQPSIIINPIGTSINHFLFFFYLGILGSIVSIKEKKLINSFLFLFIISIILELLHYFIPNRAFELQDLLANSSGVIFANLIFKFFKKIVN